MKTKAIMLTIILLFLSLSVIVNVSAVSLDKSVFENNYFEKSKIESFSEEHEFVPGEILVKFKSGTIFKTNSVGDTKKFGISSVDKLNEKYRIISYESVIVNKIGDNPFNSGFYKIKFSDKSDIFSVIQDYQKDPNIEYAEPNYIYHTSIFPNDPYFNQQWALKQYNDCDIDAPEAWDIEQGNNIVIAIHDTGVDYNHHDIIDNMWINEDEIPDNGLDDDGNGFVDDFRGWNFNNYDNGPLDKFGHGTHCSGIAAAMTDNALGIAGVSWNCKIMPVKISDSASLYLDKAVDGILYAVDNGADIISMSWGGESFSYALQDAINYAYSEGVTLVAAAGNEDVYQKQYPAAFENVIAVAATNQNDEKTSFSNYGSWVDVAAPGFDILSLRANNTDMYRNETHIVDELFYLASGTSMACPYVSGLAALILSKRPDLNQEELKTILHSTIDPVNSEEYIGIGRINAYKALQSNSNIIANLNSSLDDEIVHGLVNITGTAYGVNFTNYVVYFGKGVYPSSWVEIKESSTPVMNNILSNWNTNLVADEIYTIRLVVQDNNGGLSEDRALLLIDNVNITLPVNNSAFRGGENLEIRGNVPGPNLENYIIEWKTVSGSKSKNRHLKGTLCIANSWSTDGIILSNNGESEVIDGILGTWDTSVVSDTNFYAIRLTANYLTHTNYETIMIYINTELEEGWPQKTEGYLGHISKIIVEDLDGDGNKDIIVDAWDGRIYAWNYYGENLPGWPVVSSDHFASPSSIGDLDNDGDMELVSSPKDLIKTENDGTNISILSAWDHNGNLLENFPIYLEEYPPNEYSLFWWSGMDNPVLIDMDDDGDLEIIVGIAIAENHNHEGWINYFKFYAYHHDGSEVNGWPFVIQVAGNDTASIGGTPAAADIDGDGEIEIVIALNLLGDNVEWGKLYLVDSEGNTGEGNWPITVNGRINSAPALADFDHDGDLEIAFGSDYPDSQFFVVDHLGNNLPGWPKEDIGDTFFVSAPAIGDLDGDGIPEIIQANGLYYNNKVFAWHIDGSAVDGWPVSFNEGYSTRCSPIIGDIDGDNTPEIIVGNSDDKMYAWHSDGSRVEGWPKILDSGSYATPAIADLDNDGTTELIVASYQGYVYLYDLDCSYSPTNVQWPQFHYNPQHTGLYPTRDLYVNINNPQEGYLYLFNRQITKTIFGRTIIIGSIELEVITSKNASKVEIYIDNTLKETINSEPYSWRWKRGAFLKHRHTIKIVAYDKNGDKVDKEMVVWKFF